MERKKVLQKASPYWLELIPGSHIVSSPSIMASACLITHVPKEYSDWGSTQNDWGSKKASSSYPVSKDCHDPAVSCPWGCSGKGQDQRDPDYKTSSQSTSKR